MTPPIATHIIYVVKGLLCFIVVGDSYMLSINYYIEAKFYFNLGNEAFLEVKLVNRPAFTTINGKAT